MCDITGNNHFITLIQKTFEAVPKMGLVFHKMRLTENTVDVPTIPYIYKKYLKDMP